MNFEREEGYLAQFLTIFCLPGRNNPRGFVILAFIVVYI